MAEQAIASGAAILTANADGLTNGLKKSTADVEQFGKKTELTFEKTQHKIDKAFAKYAKKEGGFLGTIGSGILGDLGLGAPAALIGGTFIALKQIAHIVDDMGGFSHEFNKQLEKSGRLSEELAKTFDHMLKRTSEWTAAIVDPEAKATKLAEDIAASEKELAGALQAAKSAQKNLDDFHPLNSLENFRAYVSPFANLEDLKKPVTAAFNEANAKASKLRDRLNELREQRLRLVDPSQDPALAGDTNRLIQNLEREIETFGKSADAIKEWDLKRRGANETSLELIHNLNAEKESIASHMAALKEQNKANEEFDNWMKELQLNSILTAKGLELTTDQMKLFKAELGGMVDNNKIDQAWKMLGKTQAGASEPMFAGAFDKGSADAYSAILRNRYGDQGVSGNPMDKQIDKLEDIRKALDEIKDQLGSIAVGVIE